MTQRIIKKKRYGQKRAYKGLHINNGYLYVYMPTHPKAHGAKGLYYPLHKLVLEWDLGEFLPEGMVVHHVDGDTLNNHPNNLVGMGVSQHNSLTAKNRSRNKHGKLK